MSVVPCPSSVPWQGGFLSALPVIERQIQHAFRRHRPEQQEESVQESVAAACLSYQRLAAQGSLNVASPTRLAHYAVRHTRSGRHVGGSQEAVTEPLGRRSGVTVQSLHSSDRGCDPWRGVVLADRRSEVAELACFRLDFEAWLAQRSRRDRQVIAGLCKGEQAKAVAGRLGLSSGRVSQLRREYERSWREFQGEGGATAAA